MKTLLIPCLALLLTACATTDSNRDRSGSAEPDLPAISIFYSELSDELREDCKAHKDQSVWNSCEENQYDINAFANALNDSGRFEGVSYGQVQADYQVLVSSARKVQEDAKGLANAIVSGASLTLIPLHFDMTLSAEFVVLWRGEVVDQFSHEFSATQSASIIKKVEPIPEFVARLLAERLMQDIDQHNPFTPERLAEALKSSDYSQLDVPEELANYRQIDQYRYRDPFMGNMISFNHNQFAFDRIDVFVYPIRSTDWSDSRQVIESEMENIRAEIQHMEKEGYIKDIELNASRASPWDSGQEEPMVGFMDGHYSNSQSERVYTATYTFVKEDKFVKVRASFPITDEGSDMQAPDDFVQALLASVSVPEESLFMARVRKMHRESSMND
ncbi:hypothetical protein [Marinimicrobium sp. C2-29]|uniref:hypothetical protein n=1 Tax=Marinimicrobium sp. C2-29 TaxID=3139825 RepID=UPI003138B239